MEIGKGLFHVLGTVYLIYAFYVLRAYLVDDVGGIGLISIVMSLMFEKPEMSGLAKLNRFWGTSLRF